jgi:hypothetical protein
MIPHLKRGREAMVEADVLEFFHGKYYLMTSGLPMEDLTFYMLFAMLTFRENLKKFIKTMDKNGRTN